MADHVAQLPVAAAAAAKDSVGAAVQIAQQIGEPIRGVLVSAAAQSFMDGLYIALLIGSGLAVAGGLLAICLLPGKKSAPQNAPSATSTLNNNAHE
jgi:hypothetical protein